MKERQGDQKTDVATTQKIEEMKPTSGKSNKGKKGTAGHASDKSGLMTGTESWD